MCKRRFYLERLTLVGSLGSMAVCTGAGTAELRTLRRAFFGHAPMHAAMRGVFTLQWHTVAQHGRFSTLLRTAASRKRARRKRARRRAHSEARGAVRLAAPSPAARARRASRCRRRRGRAGLAVSLDLSCHGGWGQEPLEAVCRCRSWPQRSQTAERQVPASEAHTLQTRCGRATSLTEPAGALVVMALVWWPPQSCARRAAARRHAERHSRVLGHKEGGRRDGGANKRVDGVVKCELGHSR